MFMPVVKILFDQLELFFLRAEREMVNLELKVVGSNPITC